MRQTAGAISALQVMFLTLCDMNLKSMKRSCWEDPEEAFFLDALYVRRECEEQFYTF